jgi:hypothetical protein
VVTSVDDEHVVFAGRHVDHLRVPVAQLQILVEPLPPRVKLLRADDVHEARHELRALQQEVEVVEDHLRIPEIVIHLMYSNANQGPVSLKRLGGKFALKMV